MSAKHPFAKGPNPNPKNSHPRWGPRQEKIFIDALIETANISAAIRETNFSHTLVYKRKGLDPDFAARWEQALDIAYDRIDEGLLDIALKAVAEGGALADAKLSVRDVIAILTRRDKRVAGGRAPGPLTRRRDPEAARAAILKKVGAIKRARKRGGETAGGGEA